MLRQTSNDAQKGGGRNNRQDLLRYLHNGAGHLQPECDAKPKALAVRDSASGTRDPSLLHSHTASTRSLQWAAANDRAVTHQHARVGLSSSYPLTTPAHARDKLNGSAEG